MMKYVPRDIRQIKLVTGDELLTEVVGEDQIEFLIRNPLRVHKERMVLKGLAREANFFTRWMSFADNQEFIIDKRHIVTEGIVDDNVAEYYNRMMENIESDDEVTMGAPSEADHPDLLDSTEEEDGDKPTFH
jgi:hypothetical protein